MIQQARVYDLKKLPIEQQRAEYGVRVLTTRKWLQGVSKSDIDIWLPEAGPSLALLSAWRAQEIAWTAFVERYEEEQCLCYQCSPRLYSNGVCDIGHTFHSPARYLSGLASHQLVTVLCWEQGEQCHRHTLVDLVRAQ